MNSRSESQTVDQEIVNYKIHPGLGIARMGNSPDEYYVGPLSPGETPDPEGGFKDKLGRIKRQAAEFRIYGYNKDGVAVKEITADDAEIVWNAHLVNRKPEHHQFVGLWWESQYPEFVAENPKRPPLRNEEVLDPKDREKLLVIDPGPRTIQGRRTKGVKFDTGTFGPLPYTVISLGGLDESNPDAPSVNQSNAAWVEGSRSGSINKIYKNPPNAPPTVEIAEFWKKYPNQVLPPVSYSVKKEVPLGELQTDDAGRLLVLGGAGKSESVIPLNPIGFLNTSNYFANNDYWYDDTSDGPVGASIKLKDGRTVDAEGAWVLVVPPKYAVGARPLTTLYEVALEAWEEKKGIKPEGSVSFTKDIYPILARLQQYHWLNAAANRGHGPTTGQHGDFLNPQGDMFETLHRKGEKYSGIKKSVFGRLRPPDLLGEPSPTTTDTQQSRSYASSYYMPQMSGDGADATVYQDSDPDSATGILLGSFYVTWLTLTKKQYGYFEAWSQDKFDDDWTGKPEPVIPIWEYPVEQQPSMLDKGALDPCIGGAFFPGIEMTYVARYPDTWSDLCRVSRDLRPGDITRWMALPWQADFSECNTNWWPAARPDDVVPESEYQELLSTYSKSLEGQLEAVLADRKPWARGIPNESPGIDNSMVYAWKDFGFIVPKKYPRDEPGAQTVYVETDRSPYVEVSIRDAFYYLMNIENYEGFLPKAHAMVEGMLAEAWKNQELMQADTDQVYKFFPFTQEAFDARMQLVYENYVRDNQSPYVFWNGLQSTREKVVNGVLQFGPFNQLDGAWLRHVTPDGPLSTINELLARIRQDELGDGNVEQNHANVYTDLLKSVNIYLPDLHTRAYADYPQLLDSAFVGAVFLLAISQFNDEFFPELLGMTLELEWGSISLPTTVDQLTAFGINPLYYQLHVGIDNASAGHGALAKQAVEMYLEIVRQQDGEDEMQRVWKRIWNGYLGFATLGTLGQDLQELPGSQSAGPNVLWNQMADMITAKAPYASLMHGDIKIGENRLNDWFEDPFGLMVALQEAGLVIPGDLDSPIFRLTSFSGPMYHVFTDEELSLWQRWVLSLPTTGGKPAGPRKASKRESVDVTAYKQMRIVVDMLRSRQQGATGHKVRLTGPDPNNPGQKVSQPLHWWFDLGANLVGKDQAEQLKRADDLLLGALSDESNGWIQVGNVLESPMVTAMATGFGDMAEAFRDIAPGTESDDNPNGITYLEALANWIMYGCPIGEVPTPKVTALVAAAAEFKRKRRHPWGMGKVH